MKKLGKVIAIELDSNVLKILNDRFMLYSNFELIHNDVLKVDLKELIYSNLTEFITKCKIVANLPYYITTPIIMKLLENNLPLESITVMVQKEVADRLTAIPGQKNSGSITYSIYYYSTPHLVLDVPRNSFLPVPDVDSAVINLTLLKEPRTYVKDEKLFFNIIKSAFSQKRKTLINSLINLKILNSRTEAENLLNSINLDLQIRGEKLSIEDFTKLTNLICDYNSKTKTIINKTNNKS